MHAGTNLGPPFNRSASSLTPSKTPRPGFFQSFLSLFTRLFLVFFFIPTVSLSFFLLVYPALFHSHLTTLAPLQSTHPHHSLCCFLSFPPPHILLSSVPTFASCTCLSGFCLFIPSSADAFLLLTFSSFPPLGSSLYLFLWVFSLYRHP